jgi:hypothetical protein
LHHDIPPECHTDCIADAGSASGLSRGLKVATMAAQREQLRRLARQV